MKTSIIIDNLNWEIEKDVYPITKNIIFQKFKASNASILFKKQCEKLQIDDDPQSYQVHILLNEDLLDETYPYWHTPNSIISEICNILVFCRRFPLTTYSIITSKDDFKSSWLSPIRIHSEYNLIEALTMDINCESEIKKILSSINRNYVEGYPLKANTLNNVQICYNNLVELSKNKRVRNAFDFFFNAWHSHQMEHICINLSITLEALFSPSDNRELINQIALTASHFLGANPKEKEKIYEILKTFYNIRSRLVHGGTPNYNKLSIMTSVVFMLCGEMLKKIFLNIEIANLFANTEERNKLFKKYMFN